MTGRGIRRERYRPPASLRARSVLAGEASAAAAEVEASLEVPPDPDAAAFFDVDNTLVRGASIFYLARGLWERDFFRTRDIARAAVAQARFRLGAEDAGDVAEARSTALAFIEGREVAEIAQIADEVFDEYLADRIWPGTKAIAQMHLDQGQRVWIVSAAPVEIASIIAVRLGFTGALGTVAESVDGVYTGHLVGDMLHGEAKAQAVRALADREGLDLSRCAAYSDSVNDVPMLSLVGNPCAVNPDRELRAHARTHDWRIRDYRGAQRRRRLGMAATTAGATGMVAAGVALRRRARASAGGPPG